ncbi:MAG: hypothetical protein IJ509_04225 [Bacilli bacterium]|nr:hypothetical protein [Bacilli bacterium]
MSWGQKLIVTVGAFVITFITVCTFFKEDISFILTSRTIEREYGQQAENSYFLEDHFMFVDNHEEAEVSSRQEIINSIYYLINSGVSYSKRYCAKDYDTCYQDMESISSDTNLLSILNNYVHPYNSFDSIIFNFDENVIEIEIKHTYTEEEKQQINNRIDTILQQNVRDNMTVKEKIKTLHDYIINHAEYDTLKTENINDTTYRSNTAYGVLIEGFGICSGYSDAMKIFLDKLNIINYKVSNDQHIWNLVLLDGTWFHLDLTWDDPVSDKNITRDNYFLITTKTLETLNDGVHYFDKVTFSEAK